MTTPGAFMDAATSLAHLPDPPFVRCSFRTGPAAREYPRVVTRIEGMQTVAAPSNPSEADCVSPADELPRPSRVRRVDNAGLRVMIAGGGTGGHLFPGIALAEEIRARGGDVRFVGTERGIEARVLPEQGWELDFIEASGIKGRGAMGLLRGLLKLPGAWWQSRRLIRSFRPDVVLGVGGYASGPLVATAAMMRIPTAIMEQNSVPGITNRILGRMVSRVFCSFEDSGFFPARRALLTGNPIRKQLLTQLTQASEDTAEHPPRLFVFGGSQGARAINHTVLAAVPMLLQQLPELEIWHQTGKADFEDVRGGYAGLGLDAPKVRVAPFLKDMATPYGWADLVLCRAGATTVAELAAVGKPAVLIPFPFATDNHQELNARALVEGGAAVMQRESEWTVDGLSGLLASLLSSPSRLAKMRKAM
ncbi:MAG: undecaprenyldiphospho-muramoylpentapeptide beta-N-acetylglucosaminyltransferase, partial [Nannocystaceae bacterium]